MTISFRHIDNYDRQEIKQSLDQLFSELGGVDKLLSGRQNLLLKPNFVVPESKEKGACTHPDFYMSVAEYLIDHGKQVSIGESPAFGSCQMALRFHGVIKECREKGINYFTFSKAESYEGVEGSKQFGKLTIARELQEYDGLINLPKLKVHQQFVFTAATKNLYGCVTGKRKAYRHFVCENNPQLFAKMILANAETAKPVLNIGDGILAMHKKGPRGGEVYPLNKMILSDSYLEHDWLFCDMINFDQMKTPLFQVLSDEELNRLKTTVNAVREKHPFEPAENFVPSFESDIAFSAGRIVKSVWKSIKTACL